jgi:hypothetical protein
MNPSRNDGTRGEQGAGFILGEAGYFLVDGPSGAGGHAANAHGPDGVAFNPANGDLIIYDVKDYLATVKSAILTPGPVLIQRNVNSASALVQNLSAAWFDRVITFVESTQDMPSRVLIASRLRACRAALTSGRNWPANTRVAVLRWGGGAIGIGPALRAMNISFIDLTTDQIVANAKNSRRKAFQTVGDLIDSVNRAISRESGEHATQIRLITTVDTSSLKGLGNTATGFAGFITNSLFNTLPPNIGIWNQGQSTVQFAQRLLREGNLTEASAAAIQARFEYLVALKKFVDWKSGLHGDANTMGAGTKMQIAIGATAVVLCLAAVAAFVATPAAAAAAGAGSTAGASAQTATMARIATTIATAEAKFRIAETAVRVLEEEADVVVESLKQMTR